MRKNVRQDILNVFITLVAKEGLEATSLDKIAARLKMRRNHVGYYFPSRKSLIQAALQACIEVGQAVTVEGMQGAQGGEDLVSRWSAGAFDWLEKYPEHGAVVILFYGLCHHDGAMKKLNTDILETGVKRAAAELRRSTSRKLAGVEGALRDIQTYNWGLLMRYLTTQSRVSLKRLKQTAAENALSEISPYLKGKDR